MSPLLDAYGQPIPSPDPGGVPLTPDNFASAFIDMVAVEEQREFRRTLHANGLIAKWRAEWNARG